MTPRIEVIVPTYNRAHLIAETLDSILGQADDVLVHVMDDGSTDGTDAVLAPYVATRRVTYSWAPNTGGPVQPRNRGLAGVRAPYVAFFDADDLMGPGYLRRALDLFDAHPAWPALVSDYRNFSDAGDARDTHFASCPALSAALRAGAADGVLELDARAAHLILVRENFALTSSVLYRTPALRTLGGFDESLRFSEDFHLLWRAANLGPIGVSSAVAFRRRLHEGNVSHQSLVILKDKVRSREMLLAEEPDPQVRSELRAAVARFMAAHAVALMPHGRWRACRLAARALRVGVPVGVWPGGVAKAFVKSVLGRAP